MTPAGDGNARGARSAEPRSKRSSAARGYLAGLHLRNVTRLALLLLLLTHAPMARALDLDVLIGFGQSTTSGARYRPDSWTPVTVYLTGAATRGLGQLQISVQHNGRQTVYTRNVSLADGPLNQSESFVIQLREADMLGGMGGGPPIEIDVRVMLNGRSIAGPKKVALPTAISPETYNLLSLTSDGSGFDFLARKKLGLIHRGFNPAAISGTNGTLSEQEIQHTPINPNATFQPLYTDPRALPAQTQGYEAIDAIALGDQPLDNLTRDQIDALKGFVRSGGLLIVSGGGDTARLRSQFFLEMLPIETPRVEVVRALPALERRYRAPLEFNGGAALSVGRLKPHARALLTDAQSLPVVAAFPYGDGTVVFTSFDFMDRSLKSWSGDVSLWRDLLRCGNTSVSARALLAASLGSQRLGALQIADALAGARANRTPPIELLLIFCAAYLVLLVPINYLVLRKIDRREWTWLTAPALILGFTIASYLFARGLKGGFLTVNRAVILETQANTDLIAGYAHWTLYSPERTTYDISFGNPASADNPYHSTVPSEIFYNFGQSVGQQLTIDYDQTGTRIRNALVRLWDQRSFDSPVLASLQGSKQGLSGGIDAVTVAKPGSNRVRVTITNRTRFLLDHCALVGRDQPVLVDDLSPGATVTKEISWNTRTSAGNIPVAYGSHEELDRDSDRRSDSPDATRRRIAAALAAVLSGSNNTTGNYTPANENSRGYGHGANVFIGWFHDPLFDIRVDGHTPVGEEVNLLIAHLPAPPSLARSADPFDTSPVVVFEDQTRAGAQGIFK